MSLDPISQLALIATLHGIAYGPLKTFVANDFACTPEGPTRYQTNYVKKLPNEDTLIVTKEGKVIRLRFFEFQEETK